MRKSEFASRILSPPRSFASGSSLQPAFRLQLDGSLVLPILTPAHPVFGASHELFPGKLRPFRGRRGVPPGNPPANCWIQAWPPISNLSRKFASNRMCSLAFVWARSGPIASLLPTSSGRSSSACPCSSHRIAVSPLSAKQVAASLIPPGRIWGAVLYRKWKLGGCPEALPW